MNEIAVAGKTPQPPRWARWSLVVVLAMFSAGLLVTLGVNLASAQAQPVTAESKNGVFVVAGQISHETYGLYLVDYEKHTICVYQYHPKDRKLRLMAARTYRFDVQLDEYNTSEPLPRDVKNLVEQHKRLGS